jgi:uncharacterized repeat protein (TIGR04076 family)
MPFKVKCKLIGFMNDVERFPCHFDYKIGEEFTYDGERVEGRICPGVLLTMVPTIWQTFFSGRRAYERIIFKYSGLSAKDPGMKKYDGIGFRPLKEAPEGSGNRSSIVASPQRPPGLRGGGSFACADCRTSAYFSVEPVDVASGGYTLPYYKREMSILEKIKSSPGMTVEEILQKFTDFERDEIYPPLYAVNVQLMLDELAEVNYIELRDGKAYPKKAVGQKTKSKK